MFKVPDANYIEPEIEDYRGHPLINALPSINSVQDTAKLINRMPAVRDSEKCLPAHIRRHAMMRILDEFLYPTRAHLQLEQMISGMLRRGYLSRNIADRSYMDNFDTATRTDFARVARNAGNEALVSSVIGCSGTGKSTAVEAILAGYNQAIFHPEYQHTQLVWLKLECPVDGKARSLCVNFFRAVDRALGTDYEKLYVKTRANAESMLGLIAHVAALHSIGLLVIDEIQHLSTSRTQGETRIVNFFVAMTNVIKTPVLFIGTPKALKIFSPTMRSARRASQFGSLRWGRFNPLELQGDKTEWEKFLERLWRLQWFRQPTPLSPPLARLFWEYSQGVAHVAVSLFYLCQARAVVSGTETIEPELVTKVFDEDLSIIHPMIKALQSGRDAQIEKFGDLELPPELIRSYGQEPETVEEPEFVHDKQSGEDLNTKLTAMLIDAGIGADVAPLAAAQAIEEKPDEDLIGLIAHVRSLSDREPAKKKKPKAAKYQPVYVPSDLRQLHDKDARRCYENIKGDGHILDITPYL